MSEFSIRVWVFPNLNCQTFIYEWQVNRLSINLRINENSSLNKLETSFAHISIYKKLHNLFHKEIKQTYFLLFIVFLKFNKYLLFLRSYFF